MAHSPTGSSAAPFNPRSSSDRLTTSYMFTAEPALAAGAAISKTQATDNALATLRRMLARQVMPV